MNRFFAFAFIFITLTALCIANIGTAKAQTPNSWTTMAPLPNPYYDVLGAAAVNGKIYFLGGDTYAQYNPETNNWTAIAPLPIYNSWATVVACQNKIYVIGGSKDQPTQVYDPATNTWENKTSIPTTRGALMANVVNDKIYVIGGGKPAGPQIIDTSYENDVYDPATDSWSKMASVPTPVMGYASAVLDDKIYIIGGGTSTPISQNATTQVQIFDPKMNQWTNGTSIPNGVCYAGACSTTGLLAPKRIYVIGGLLNYGGRYLGTASEINQVYDPETGAWSFAASIPNVRWFFSLVNVDDALYALGGTNGSVQSRNLIPEREAIAATKVQANEKYLPMGYVASPSPTPTPSLSPSPTPSISPSYSPTQQPTVEPTQTAKPAIVPIVDGVNPLPYILGIIAVAIVAIIIVGLAVCFYFKKHRIKKTANYLDLPIPFQNFSARFSETASCEGREFKPKLKQIP